jgi:hypothetical protein
VLWEQRAARNEALFREVNESIAELEQPLQAAASEPVFICDCANSECAEQLPDLGLATYEETRKHPRRFFVVPGHQNDQLERVVETRLNFLIVEKTGEAGEIAEQTQE